MAQALASRSHTKVRIAYGHLVDRVDHDEVDLSLVKMYVLDEARNLFKKFWDEERRKILNLVSEVGVKIFVDSYNATGLIRSVKTLLTREQAIRVCMTRPQPQDGSSIRYHVNFYTSSTSAVEFTAELIKQDRVTRNLRQ